MEEVEEIDYDSSDEEDTDDDNMGLVQRRTKGKNNEWIILATYPSMQEAMLDYSKDHLIEHRAFLAASTAILGIWL